MTDNRIGEERDPLTEDYGRLMASAQEEEVSSDDNNDPKWDALLYNDPDVDDESASRLVVQKAKKKTRKLVAIAVTALILLAAAIVGYIYFLSSKNTKESQPAKETTTSKTVIDSEYSNMSNGGNPASASSVTYASSSTNTTVSVESRAIKLEGEKTVSSIEYSNLKDDIDKKADCSLKRTAASCYIGVLHVQNGDEDGNIEVFAFRDAAKSSLLMTDAPIKERTVQGSAFSYGYTTTIENKKMHVFVVTAPDQSGVMMISDKASLISSLSKDGAVRVASSGKKS